MKYDLASGLFFDFSSLWRDGGSIEEGTLYDLVPSSDRPLSIFRGILWHISLLGVPIQENSHPN